MRPWNGPGRFFNLPGLISTHRAAAILQSASEPSAMLSLGDPTGFKNIERHCERGFECFDYTAAERSSLSAAGFAAEFAGEPQCCTTFRR